MTTELDPLAAGLRQQLAGAIEYRDDASASGFPVDDESWLTATAQLLALQAAASPAAADVKHLTGIPRLRAAILDAIDHPADVIEGDRKPDETDVEFAIRVVTLVLAAVWETEWRERVQAGWKPTGFLNQPATPSTDGSTPCQPGAPKHEHLTGGYALEWMTEATP